MADTYGAGPPLFGGEIGGENEGPSSGLNSRRSDIRPIITLIVSTPLVPISVSLTKITAILTTQMTTVLGGLGACLHPTAQGLPTHPPPSTKRLHYYLFFFQPELGSSHTPIVVQKRAQSFVQHYSGLRTSRDTSIFPDKEWLDFWDPATVFIPHSYSYTFTKLKFQ